MGIYDCFKNGFVTGVKSFLHRSSAREYFSKKYAFMGERLQKLCSNTGLKSVEAEVNTGEWFLAMRTSDNYQKFDTIKILATPESWKVVIPR